jgi:hypothetical protein
LHGYERAWLGRDLVAGLIVGSVRPQALVLDVSGDHELDPETIDMLVDLAPRRRPRSSR